MRRLLPDAADDVDVYDAYRPPDPHAPLLRLDMVMSVDGLATDRSGRTEGLGGEGDHEVFRTLRALADCVLVGAGTVRAEGYGPHRLPPALAQRRLGDGRPAPAAIAVVSASLELDVRTPLFTAAVTRTIVVTCAAADAARRAALEVVATVVVAGEDRVDLPTALRMLREEHGAASIVCEGGPLLNDGLLAAGLIDELCLTLAPQLVGIGGLRIVGGLPAAVDLDLLAVHEQDGELYLRYGVGRLTRTA